MKFEVSRSLQNLIYATGITLMAGCTPIELRPTPTRTPTETPPPTPKPTETPRPIGTRIPNTETPTPVSLIPSDYCTNYSVRQLLDEGLDLIDNTTRTLNETESAETEALNAAIIQARQNASTACVGVKDFVIPETGNFDPKLGYACMFLDASRSSKGTDAWSPFGYFFNETAYNPDFTCEAMARTIAAWNTCPDKAQSIWNLNGAAYFGGYENNSGTLVTVDGETASDLLRRVVEERDCGKLERFEK